MNNQQAVCDVLNVVRRQMRDMIEERWSGRASWRRQHMGEVFLGRLLRGPEHEHSRWRSSVCGPECDWGALDRTAGRPGTLGGTG